MIDRPYRDSAEAGQYLAKKLAGYAGRPDVLVLALPRGGVPVAYEVARALGAPLDVFLVRKLGVPGHEELAMGAIASGGLLVLNQDMVRVLGIGPDLLKDVISMQRAELQRRDRQYRGDRPPPDVRGKTVILIDDGLATGASMRAAVAALRQQDPARLVVAVPIAAPTTCAELRDEVDEIVCARTPEPFRAVGLWYEDFTQTTDDEVRDLLRRARESDDTASKAAQSQSR
jgi:putative phosphoribosyl transferase